MSCSVCGGALKTLFTSSYCEACERATVYGYVDARYLSSRPVLCQVYDSPDMPLQRRMGYPIARVRVLEPVAFKGGYSTRYVLCERTGES